MNDFIKNNPFAIICIIIFVIMGLGIAKSHASEPLMFGWDKPDPFTQDANGNQTKNVVDSCKIFESIDGADDIELVNIDDPWNMFEAQSTVGEYRYDGSERKFYLDCYNARGNNSSAMVVYIDDPKSLPATPILFVN